MSRKLRMRWTQVVLAALTLAIEVSHLRSQYKLEATEGWSLDGKGESEFTERRRANEG